jgi:cytochrome c-type biogenesis protein
VLSGLNPAIAFLAGLASFVSPCVLPLVPAYLAYLVGSRTRVFTSPLVGEVDRAPKALGPEGTPKAPGPEGRMSLVLPGAGFVVGLSLIFILFFYVFSLAVQPIRAYVPVVAGLVVIVMALHVAGLIRIPFLDTEYRLMKTAPQGGGAVGGFLLGIGFASGWTPCIGVTLGAVLSSAVTAGTTPQGLSLMLAYCLGLGLPFIALALALENARPLITFVNAHRRAIDLGSAAVLVAMGILLLTNNLTLLSASLTQLVPDWPSPSL